MQTPKAHQAAWVIPAQTFRPLHCEIFKGNGRSPTGVPFDFCLSQGIHNNPAFKPRPSSSRHESKQCLVKQDHFDCQIYWQPFENRLVYKLPTVIFNPKSLRATVSHNDSGAASTISLLGAVEALIQPNRVLLVLRAANRKRGDRPIFKKPSSTPSGTEPAAVNKEI